MSRSTVSVLWLGLAVLSGLLFLVLLVLVESSHASGEDRSLELTVHGTLGSGTYAFFRAVSLIGGGSVRTALVILVALALLWWRYWKSAALLLTCVAGASLLYTLIKVMVARPRPHLFPRGDQVSGYSFPSGHATDAFAFFFVLAYLLWHLTGRRHIGLTALAVAAIFTALVGLSRVVLGVHYPSDVLAGFALSGCWLALLLALFTRP